MTQTTAQVLLTLLLLLAAVIFVILGADQLAIGLVGAICGQGVSVSVRSAVNGNGNR